MATQERKAQLKFAVDGAEVKSGVEQIKGDVRDMAQDVAKSGEQAAKGVGAIGRSLDDLGKKSAETSSKTAEGTERMDAAARKMQAALERQALALQTGVISVGKYNAAYYEGLAALRGYGDALAPTIARLREAEAASKTAADAQKRLAEQTQFLADIDRQAASIGKTQVQLLQERARALGVSDQAAASIDRLDAAMQRSGNTAAQTAAAMRGVPAQITDIITSLQGGQAPLTVFLQQGGQLRDMFGSTGAAARALGSTLLTGLANPAVIAGGAVLGLAAAYHTGSAEMDGYRAALVNSGNAAGVTAGQLQLYAQRIDGVIGTQAAAAAGLVEFVSAGVQGGEQLERFTRIAIGWEKATGTAVASVAKQFGDLDKDPLQAVLRLNESMNFLTDSTYGNIKALVEQGKTTEAAALAQKTFADVLEQRTAEVEKNLGTIEKGWRAVKNAIAEAIDAALGVGRMAGPEVQLEKQQALVTHLESELAKRKNRGLATGDYDAQLKAAKERLGILQEEVLTQQNQAALDGVRAENFKARLAWDEVVKANLSKQQKDEQEIARIRNLGLAAGKSDLEIQKAISAYRAKGNSSGGASALNDSLSAQVQAYKNADKAILDERKSFYDQLGLMAKLGTQGEFDIIDASLAKEEEIWARRQANFQAEIAQASKKKNSAAEVARITGQMQDAERNYLQNTAKLRADAVLAEMKYADALDGRIAKQEAAARAAQLQVRTAQEEGKAIGLTGDALREHNEAIVDNKARRLEALAVWASGIDLSGQLAKAYLDEAAALRTLSKEQGENRSKQLVYEYAKGIEDSNRLLQAEVDLMGLSTREREITLEQLRIQLDLEQKIAQIKSLEGDTPERAARIAKMQASAAIAKANASSRVFLEDWKRSVQQYDDIFRQGFADMLNNGEAGWDSFTKSLATTFKTTVADQIYKAFLQPIVVNVVGNLMGMTGALGMLGGGGGGSGGAMGLLNGASTLNTAYNLFNGGIASSLGAGVTQLGTMFGNQAAMQFGMGMQGMYLPPGVMGPGVYSSTGAMGAAAGTAVGIGAGVLGGIYGGRLVSGGFSMSGNSSGNSAVNTGTAVGAAVGSIIPVIGTALGALIGGLLGGAFNRAFGYKLKDSGLEATLGSNADGGSESRLYEFYKGGWFKGDKTEYSQTDPNLEKFLDGAVMATRASLKSLAEAFDLPTVAIDTFGLTIKESFKGLDEEETNQKIAEIIERYANGVSEAFIAGFGEVPDWIDRIAKSDGAAADKLKAIAEMPNQLLQAFGTSRDALVQTFAQGLVSGDAMGAGQAVADQLVGSIEAAMLSNAAGAVFDIVNRGIVTPMLDAIATGASVSEALSQASIDKAVQKATEAAQAFAAIWNDESFKAAMEQIRTSVGSALGTAGAAMQYQPQYIRPAQDLTKAADDAAKAAEDARKKWEEVWKTLRSDRDSAEIDLLRAMGQEEAALARERARAIEGMDAEQAAYWDGTRAILNQVAALEVLNSLREEETQLQIALMRAQGDEAGALAREREIAIQGMTAEQVALYDSNRALEQRIAALDKERALMERLPGVIDKYLTPEQRTAAQYDRIAGSLIDAGVSGMDQSALSAGLAAASKDDIAALAAEIWNMGGLSADAKAALLDAADALADLKNAAIDAAEAQLKATQDWRASLGATLEGAYLQTLAPDAQVQYLRGKESSLWDALDGAEHPVDVAQKLQQTILERIGVEARLRAQVSQETLQGLQAQLGAAQSLKGALDSLRLGSDSALNPYEQLLYAGGKFDDAYKRALAGDVGAWADVQSFGQSYVKLGRENYASSTDAADIFFKVTGAMDELVAKGLAVEPQVQALQALGKTGEDQLWQAQQQVQALTRLDGAMQRQQERQQAQLDKLTGAADRQIEQLKEQNALLRAQIEQQAAIAREQREREGQILAELAAVRESARMAEAQTQ